MKTELPTLEELFHPQSIAIVGVSADMTRWNSGRGFLLGAKNPAFKGKVYAVGLQGGEVFRMKIYPTLKDVPGPVDYVTSAIPAAQMFQLIEDASSKGARAIHLFTAGFSETGRKESADMETLVVAAAHKVGIRIIGPNCMGLYCPASGLSFEGGFPMTRGHVGLMSQSGGNTDYAVREGTGRGVFFSKVISFGNASDINEGEILEFLARDDDTEIILVYIEGVRDGGRLRNALADAVRWKPVVVYKSGMTAEGARAAVSHTASIAGSNAVWDALFKQTGALRVYNVEELNDMAEVHARLAPPAGVRVAVLGVGGGAAVLASDECAKAGVKLPLLSPAVQARLMGIMLNDAGSSFRNPIDIRPGLGEDQVKNAVAAVMRSGEVDVLLVQMEMTWASVDVRWLDAWVKGFLSASEDIRGRCVVALHHITKGREQLAVKMAGSFRQAGLPVFPTIERAATAVSRYAHLTRERSGGA